MLSTTTESYRNIAKHTKRLILLGCFFIFIVCWSAAYSQSISITGHYAEGTTNEVYVKNGYLYMASGCLLKIYDIQDTTLISQLSWQTNPVSELDVGSQIQGFYSDSNYFYITAREKFLIIDDSDPFNLSVIGSYNLPFGSSHAFKYAMVQNHSAYLLKTGLGMIVLDISDPSHPDSIGEWHAPSTGDCWRLNISGNYVYLGMAYYLYIIDISNPSDPVLANTLDFYPNSISSIAIRDTIAYMVEYHWGLWSFDISDPSHPIVLDSIRGANNPNASDVKLLGNYAYLSTRYEGFRIYDITDPANLTLVSISDSSYEVGYSESLFPIEKYVFTTAYTEGVQSWSTWEIPHPEFLSSINVLGDVGCLKVVGSYMYIAPRNGGIWVVDVSDPAHPFTANYADETYGRYYSIAHQGNYLYIIGAWGGLNIFDISDPINPMKVIEDWGPNGGGSQPTTLFLDGNLAYYNVEDSGLCIVDISNPYHPQLVAQTDIPDYGTAKWQNFLIVASDSNHGLCIVNIADSANPHIAGTYPYHNYYGCPVANAGNIVYAGWGNCFQSYDIIDPFHPVALDSLVFGDWSLSGGDIIIKGNYAYCTGNYLKIFDISDPANLVLVEDFTELAHSDPNGLMALFGDSEFHNDYWYVSAGSCGVFILSSYSLGIFPENTNMTDNVLKNYPNPFFQSTVIGYQLSVSGKVVVKAYDILGHEIRTLVNSNQSAGKHSVVWDGTTDTGEPVVSGIYFCKLNIDDKPISTIYMMLLK